MIKWERRDREEDSVAAAAETGAGAGAGAVMVSVEICHVLCNRPFGAVHGAWYCF